MADDWTTARRYTIDAGDMDELEHLVEQLDADSIDQAEEAQAELIHRGRDADVVAPLIRVLPTFGRYGQLCAIEVLQELDDRRADQPLINLLDSEHTTVREWAAGALGWLRVHDAIPAIQRAYQASLTRHDPPDYTEPVTLRQALTDLGARQPVTPRLTDDLRVTAPNGRTVWPSTRLPEVTDDLAQHSQVVLYFQLWRTEPDGRMHNEPVRCGVIELDFTQPWPATVRQAHIRATVMAHNAAVAENVLAAIEWIDQNDLVIAHGPEPV